MRSTFNGLNTMVRGIFANQLSLDTTGHNIVNADTAGYSRQSVNLASTMPQATSSSYGNAYLGTGVDSTSITRARNIYADKQFWSETCSKSYYDVMRDNYDRIETIFNDSDDIGIQNAMSNFWKSWIGLSAHASDSDYRKSVLSQGTILVNLVKSAADKLREQIDAQYDEMSMRVNELNRLTSDVIHLNRQILAQESNGANANDLRDQRDLIVDEIATYVNINTYEDEDGMYSINSGGVSLVNGVSKLTFELSQGYRLTSEQGVDYGVMEHNILIKEAHLAFKPTNGSLKGNMDAIDECKNYIDALASMAATMLTDFNKQHAAGFDYDGNPGGNFFGQYGYDYGEKYFEKSLDKEYYYVEKNGTKLTGYEIIDELKVSIGFSDWALIAANEDTETTGQGNNAVLLADYFNMLQTYNEKTGDVPAKYNYYDEKWNNITTEMSGLEDNQIDADGRYLIYTNGTDKVYQNGTGYEDANGKVLLASGDSTGVTFTYANDTDNTISAAYDDDSITVYDNGTTKIYRTLVEDTSTSLGFSVVYSDGTDEYEMDPPTGLGSGSVSKTVTYTNKTDSTKTYTIYRSSALRGTGDVSIWDFYNQAMTKLGTDAEEMDIKVELQEDVMTQTENWRASEMGVDWNEELTNMIKFQKGFGACSRMLSAMDEMLDRLVNSTGMVGR